MSVLKYKYQLIFLTLVLFHSIGIIGLNYESLTQLFRDLTPFNLLLTLILFLWGNNEYNRLYWKTFLLIFIIGYGVEVLGVATGYVFGEYRYGETLGIKLFDVPLMIGVNWLLLSLISSGVVQFFFAHKVVIVILSALLMVVLDIIIEPVAIQYDFWSWKGGVIPIQNYVMWFVTAIVIQTIIQRKRMDINPFVSAQITIVLLLFFAILNFTF